MNGMVNQSRPEVQHREDVGMLQPSGESDLSEKPVAAEAHGELGMQSLERDRPVVSQVMREVHRRHAASTQLALNRVAVAQGAP
jgi:hypothetical protein